MRGRYLTLLVVLGMTLSACTGATDFAGGQDISAASSEDDKSNVETSVLNEAGIAEFDTDGSATDNLPAFRQALEDSGAGQQPVDVASAISRLVSVGFEPSSIKSSSPTTKTGRIPDSVSIAVLIGSECLVGQFSGDWLNVAVLPSLEGDCLIGDVEIFPFEVAE